MCFAHRNDIGVYELLIPDILADLLLRIDEWNIGCVEDGRWHISRAIEGTYVALHQMEIKCCTSWYDI